MSEQVEIVIQHDGGSEPVRVTEVGPGRWSVKSAVWVSEQFNLGDIVELSFDTDSYRFQRVVAIASHKRSSSILPIELAESPEIQEILDRVLTCDGYWERIFGGCIFVAVPAESSFDVEAAILGAAEAFERRLGRPPNRFTIADYRARVGRNRAD